VVEAAEDRERHEEPEPPAQVAEVVEADVRLVVDGAERGRIVYTDGRKVNRDYGEGRLVEVKARWKKGVLQIDRKGERGSQRERYQLSEDGQRLTVEATLQMGQMGKIEISSQVAPTRVELTCGWGSKGYMQKTEVPMLEVEFPAGANVVETRIHVNSANKD